MRKVLFLFSPGSNSSMEELVATSYFSDCAAQGVFLKERPESGKTFPFPCYTLSSPEEKTELAYPAINYSDVLKMVFEAETIIS